MSSACTEAIIASQKARSLAVVAEHLHTLTFRHDVKAFVCCYDREEEEVENLGVESADGLAFTNRMLIANEAVKAGRDAHRRIKNQGAEFTVRKGCEQFTLKSQFPRQCGKW